MQKVRKYAIAYFVLQGVGVLAWWIALFVKPEWRRVFQLDASPIPLLAFWIPDLAFLTAGSFAAAATIFYKSRYEIATVWFVTGAITYASIYTLTYSFMTDRGWIGVALMLPAMIWSGVFATGLTVGSGMFRQARESSTGYVLLKTYSQIFVVWSLILIFVPFLLTLLEDKLGIQQLAFPYQRPLAAVVFVLVSTLGIWAANSMSRIGKGTPLPLDHASDLVVVGPYAFVRNPMAVSGIFQGLAVALFLGSGLVAAYALMGSLIWQLIFRPLEEDDLAIRFGNSYRRYRDGVQCWVPRRTRYQIDSTADSSNSVDLPLGRM